MEAVPVLRRTIEESAHLRRVGRFAFPTEELIDGETDVAQLGRDGSLRIFFGPGRRVRLDDGTEWRIKSIPAGRHICPVITSEQGTIATSGPLHGERSYGINGKDYAFTLILMGKARFRGPRPWVLRRHETDIASIDDRERVIRAHQPIPIAAALMAFTLITHGIPGERDLMPARD